MYKLHVLNVWYWLIVESIVGYTFIVIWNYTLIILDANNYLIIFANRIYEKPDKENLPQ